MSILEYTGLGLLLLAPVSVILLTTQIPTGIRFWLWGWAFIVITAPMQVAALPYPELTFLAHGIGVIFPMCLLAGSFDFLNRSVPKWVFVLAAVAFAGRGLLATFDSVLAGRIATLPLEVVAYLFAAWLLNADKNKRASVNIALGLSLLTMAAVEVWDTITNDPSRRTMTSGLPWVFAYVFTGSVQIWAWMDKGRRESTSFLRSAQERFDALANYADDIIAEVNSRAEIIYVSPNCFKVLGIAPKNILGRRVVDLVQLLSAEHQGERFEFAHPDSLETIKNDGPYGTLYKVRHADGSTKFLEITASHYFTSQGEIRAVAIVRDITRRVSDEQTNLSRQKLESLGTMSAGIAHDFRNLLTTIRGSTELLQLDLAHANTPAVQTHIDHILSASDQASGLTDQLLTYAGKTPLTLSNVNLNEIIADSEPLLKSVIADRAYLHINLSAQLPYIEGNRVALQQMLINLTTNAVEALSGSDGNIWISAEARAINETHSVVDLKVTDNGQGMEEATKAHIFEPFFSTKFAGRGLGLAAIQGLVKAHKGQIAVESFPNLGATFIISFPTSQALGEDVQAVGG